MTVAPTMAWARTSAGRMPLTGAVWARQGPADRTAATITIVDAVRIKKLRRGNKDAIVENRVPIQMLYLTNRLRSPTLPEFP